MRRIVVAAAAAVVLTTSATACGSQQQPPPSASSPGSTTEAASPHSLSPAPADAVPDDGVDPGRHEPAAWDDASRTAVVDAAGAAMRAFARPDLDQASWWAAIEPMLTPEAQQDYAYVLASNIPVRQVVGSPTLADDTSAYLALVEVPTDVGTYTLTLTRTDAASPWLVSRLDPPEGAH
ncbi:hypothetical protein D4740_01815 [Actinomyces sp. 2119]|nr:hypothetical protein D4740_01815 [Actinomyces sp. 2119]